MALTAVPGPGYIIPSFPVQRWNIAGAEIYTLQCRQQSYIFHSSSHIIHLNIQ